jgi:Signal transduction histidine kinase
MKKEQCILIVDDTVENLKLLGEFLEQDGYDIRVASDGQTAIEVARAVGPDLILLDIVMPGMDGIEVCRRLKADDDLRSIPVIFISALEDSVKKIGAFEAGGVDYITKPFQAREVAARVRTHLSLSQLEALKAEVAERRAAEEKLRRSLEDREALLREVHHRVKNNLNVICSLLRLQADSIESPEQALTAFSNSINRIMSMAMVHESVYQYADSAQIDMDPYMKTLVSRIASTNDCGAAIESSVDGDQATLDINAAVPFGIILNELASNAYIHAFKGRARGRVDIRLRPVAARDLELIVADDGCGMPRESDLTMRSLGLNLAHLMVEQLSGSISLAQGQGTIWRIVFPYRQALGRIEQNDAFASTAIA